jgi:hypothetical protein
MTIENWGDVITTQKRILELNKLILAGDKLADLERIILQEELDFFYEMERWKMMRESSIIYKIKRFFRIE